MDLKSKRLVLVGAGHAHMHALHRLSDFKAEGARVSVISPGKFWYSGMGPGLLSGLYDESDDVVDVRSRVESQGATFIDAWVKTLDVENRRLVLNSGDSLFYDLLSLNVGSEIAIPECIDVQRDDVIPVKPVSGLASARQRLKAIGSDGRVLVLGGGPAGVEIALNAKETGASVTLIHCGERLLDSMPVRASQRVASAFQEQGVEFRCKTEIQELNQSDALLNDGSSRPFDLLFVATGVRPPSLCGRSELTTDDAGAMVVDQQLRSVSHPEVLGGGDCIQLRDHVLDRVGVHAVRQGPVIHQNLLRSLTSQSLADYQPQSHYLLILNLGDGTGLFIRRGIVFQSCLALWLKKYLDRSFMKKAQQGSSNN